MSVLDTLRQAWAKLRAGGARQAARQAWAGMFQTYGEPNAERVLSSYQQFAEKAFAGNSVIFGLMLARMLLFTEARATFRHRDTKKLERTDALEKLERPWPNGTLADLLARMEQDASLAGNAYVRDAGDQLERLRPDWVTIVSEVVEADDGHQLRTVIGIVYDPVGDPDRDIDFFPVAEVAHWAPIPDPLANWRGVSWITPAMRELNADLSMTEHREMFFRNAATPNMVIKYSGKMSPDQVKRIGDRINARHGGPDKAGRTLILDEGADLQVVGAQMRDVQFDELQAAGENRMAVAAQVPAIVAGLKEGLDSAAWSMYRQALRRFADQTMRPLWRGAFAALANLVDVPDGCELWYDVTDIAALQESEQEAAQTAQTNAGTLSTLTAAGFTWESAVAYVASGDLSLLDHSGLYSVQLRPPGTDEPASEAAPPAAPADPADPGDDEDQDDDPDATDAPDASDGGDAARARLADLLMRAWLGEPLDADERLELLRGFDPDLHPRDHRGRFRKIGSPDIADGLIPLGKLRDERLDALFADIQHEPAPDERAFERIGDEWDRRDSAERQRQDRITDLVAAGADYLAAYADVYGRDSEKLRREQRFALIDAERRTGETRRQAVRRAYDEWTHLRYLAAETETRGHLLTGEAQGRGIHPVSLFSGPSVRARKHASEELKRWWEDNGGRITFTEFRHRIYGGDGAELEQIRLGGNGRDFGV
ncbi:phage portal protein [Actinoplanes sp. NPDC049668]|uniref:phage portal protein n=1 Tax=unclassified Actinoplanes TaxID=2626549 RepID=UPI0033A7F1A5